MSAPTSRGEALRKEGIFVPASKGANPQNPRKTGDKGSRGKHNVTLTHNEKEKIMENTVQPNPPAVIGTPAPVATAPVATEKPIFSARRAGGLALDTLVVVATTAAAVGAGYGVYHLVTKP